MNSWEMIAWSSMSGAWPDVRFLLATDWWRVSIRIDARSRAWRPFSPNHRCNRSTARASRNQHGGRQPKDPEWLRTDMTAERLPKTLVGPLTDDTVRTPIVEACGLLASFV